MENHGGNHGLGRWQHPDCTAETQSGAGGVRTSPYLSVGGVKMAPDFSLQRVLATEERSGHYLRAAHMDQSILGLGP